MKMAIHCFVSGKVQGVWFRANTQKQAIKLNLTGWARNLPDGRVEVLACGVQANLVALYEWMKRGPELAVVEAVTYEELPWQDMQEFNIL